MIDLLDIVVLVLLFAGAVLYVQSCDRLKGTCS